MHLFIIQEKKGYADYFHSALQIIVLIVFWRHGHKQMKDPAFSNTSKSNAGVKHHKLDYSILFSASNFNILNLDAFFIYIEENFLS